MITGMTRRDQIDAVADVAGVTAAQARLALDAVAALIRVGLLEEEKFALAGVGTFSVQRRRPRNVNNPSTGLIMHLPASAVVKFKAMPTLAGAIKERHS